MEEGQEKEYWGRKDTVRQEGKEGPKCYLKRNSKIINLNTLSLRSYLSRLTVIPEAKSAKLGVLPESFFSPSQDKTLKAEGVKIYLAHSV